jgi:hypothetical protein
VIGAPPVLATPPIESVLPVVDLPPVALEPPVFAVPAVPPLNVVTMRVEPPVLIIPPAATGVKPPVDFPAPIVYVPPLAVAPPNVPLSAPLTVSKSRPERAPQAKSTKLDPATKHFGRCIIAYPYRKFDATIPSLGCLNREVFAQILTRKANLNVRTPSWASAGFGLCGSTAIDNIRHVLNTLSSPVR